MNPEVKELWVAELRSGKYHQGRSALHVVKTIDGVEGEHHEFCCLGILCELAVKAEVIPPPGVIENGASRYIYGGPNDYIEPNYLPQSVQEWAGFDTRNPEFPKPLEDCPITTLAYLNDSGFSFEQIAIIIEEEF